MSKPQVLITPVHAAVLAGIKAPVDAVVRIQVPTASASRPRPSLNLAIALDVSGSMCGQPLEQAKRAVVSIIQRLAPTDRIAVIAYDTSIETVLESMDAVQAQRLIEERLGRCHSGGGTALHDGWLHAAQAAAPFVDNYGVSRVLLISDGQATHGQCNPAVLEEEATKLAEARIGTSTYGIGSHFNEALMTKMAVGGQAFYAENADTLMSYFGNEFTMLAATMGSQVRLTASATGPNGEVLPLVNLNGHRTRDGGWVLPNLYEGAETWVALSVDAPSLAKKEGVSIAVTVTWLDADHKPQQASLTQRIEARAKAVKEDSWAVERVREARAADLQRQAAVAAQAGRFEEARGHIGLLRACAVNNAYIGGVADSLQAAADSNNWKGMAKEAAYASHTMSTRLAATNEDATVLSADRFGLRKAHQGKAAPVVPSPTPEADAQA